MPIPAKIAKNSHPRIQKKAIMETIPETSTSRLVSVGAIAIAASISTVERMVLLKRSSGIAEPTQLDLRGIPYETYR